MCTGRGGGYRFPVEQLGGLSPRLTSAIKPGYHFDKFDTSTREVRRGQDASSHSNRHIYLNPQDPAKPDFLIGTGEEFCFGATTPVYATADVMRAPVREAAAGGSTYVLQFALTRHGRSACRPPRYGSAKS